MTLTLQVVGPEAEKLGPGARKVFSAAGGTIGRLPDNTWVLPDPYVSSRHAVIGFQDGRFFIEDTSTNGVCINSPDTPLAKRQRYPLKSGDWIFIDPYEIRAEVTADSAVHAFDPDPFAASPPAPSREASPGWPSAITPSPPAQPLPIDLFGSGDDAGLDPLALLGNAPPPARPPQTPARPAASGEADWHEAYVPPRPTPPPRPAALGTPGQIPEDWLSDGGEPFDTDSSSAPVGADVPPAPADPLLARPAPPDAVDLPRPMRGSGPVAPEGPSPDTASVPIALASVLEGAGISPSEMSPEFARDAGRILRIVVDGVMDMLRARQQTKAAFRLDQTTFRPRENNPLKFSANVDDALHNLFVKRNPAFLQPVDAFEDAFDDIRHHQMAMLHGMRVAFESMLAQFDPERLQEQFDRQVKKGALVAVPARLRYWELYRDWMQEWKKDAEQSFRALFGDEFADAYEEQLKRLKAQRGGRTS